MTGHIYRQNGLKSLYQGLQATLARNIPSYGLFFAVHYSTVSILLWVLNNLFLLKKSNYSITLA